MVHTQYEILMPVFGKHAASVGTQTRPRVERAVPRVAAALHPPAWRRLAAGLGSATWPPIVAV